MMLHPVHLLVAITLGTLLAYGRHTLDARFHQALWAVAAIGAFTLGFCALP